MSTLLIAAATTWALYVNGGYQHRAGMTLEVCREWAEYVNRQTTGRPAYCLPYDMAEGLKEIRE